MPVETEKSILVIDNDEGIVTVLSFLFQEQGYVVYTAHDGAEGVELALRHHPAVIISDIVMGEMHGYEVVQRIRSHPELGDTPVIVMSAKSYKPDIERAKAVGADAYVVKPFEARALFALVDGHRIRRRSAGR